MAGEWFSGVNGVRAVSGCWEDGQRAGPGGQVWSPAKEPAVPAADSSLVDSCHVCVVADECCGQSGDPVPSARSRGSCCQTRPAGEAVGRAVGSPSPVTCCADEETGWI